MKQHNSRAPKMNVRLLGVCGIVQGKRNVSHAIHYRKGWALLGYLAVESGQRHSRDHIAQLLWPTLEPGPARTNLRQVLADLLRALDTHGGCGLLDISRDSVELIPQSATTIDLFELDACEALGGEALCADIATAQSRAEGVGGEFMQGFGLPHCAEFEAWLQRSRHALCKRTSTVLTRLCGAQQATGHLPQAIETARRLVLLGEWDERHQRLLMTLLAAAGLHQEALDQYHALGESLRAELATEPEAQTQALRVRIEADRRRGLAGGGVQSPLPATGLRGGFQDMPGPPGAVPGPPGEIGSMATDRTLTVARPPEDAGTGWLIVIGGRGIGERIRVSETPLVIGRSSDNHLCILHDTVSRHHCTLWQDAEGFHIRDLGSTNRTRINDAIVEEAELGDGDLVALGESMLRFVRGGDSQRAQASEGSARHGGANDVEDPPVT